MEIRGAAISGDRRLHRPRQPPTPLVGGSAAPIFATSLLMAGLASSVTAGLAGGSGFAGIFSEPYDIHDSHSRMASASRWPSPPS